MIIYRYPHARSAEKPQGLCPGVVGGDTSRCAAAQEPLLDKEVWELEYTGDLRVSAFLSLFLTPIMGGFI